ncbi:MAG: peptidylprolyl isomerase [Micrococcales bacterium]
MATKNSNKAKSEAQARLRNYESKVAQRESKALRRKADNRVALFVSAGAVVFALAASLGHAAVFPEPVATATPSATPTASVQASGTPSPTATPVNNPRVPKPEAAESRLWKGNMDVAGSPVAFELDGVKAPQATSNFVSLAKKGFYEGLTCHRLTTAGIFVLQCGDPRGDGTGGPNYLFGPVENAPSDNVYKTGYLAMARQSGNAYSMGSQFFIVYADSTIPSDAAGGYTVFGKITSGIDAIKAIAAKGVQGGSADGKPAETVKLSGITVK